MDQGTWQNKNNTFKLMHCSNSFYVLEFFNLDNDGKSVSKSVKKSVSAEDERLHRVGPWDIRIKI